MKYVDYERYQLWGPYFKINSSLNYKVAKNSSINDIPIVGTSTVYSLIKYSKNKRSKLDRKFHDLSIMLCGGENLLLTFINTETLPQKDVILCLSELSFFQPFKEYPVKDIIDFNNIIYLKELYFSKGRFKKHKIFKLVFKGLLYNLIQNIRYSLDIRIFIINKVKTLINFCANDVQNLRESNFIEIAKKMEIKQAKSLNLENQEFKKQLFKMILDSLIKKKKNVYVLRFRFLHPEIRKFIDPLYSDNLDGFLNQCKHQYPIHYIDFKDFQLDYKTDFSDYTHFNQKGAEKVLTQLMEKFKKENEPLNL